jgi:heme oxygenase (biliverdin-producing, ferredoxin)
MNESIRKSNTKYSEVLGNKLRELTQKQHEQAENQPFAQLLLSGNISKKKYATYLFNQHPQYNLLETLAMFHGLVDVRIAPRIHEDYQELWEEFQPHQPPLLPVVKEYMDHLMSIKDDPNKLMGHIYVRHMGDLSGGQMIARKIPGTGKMYKFDEDVKIIKERIRSKLNDDMADEANVCFEFATKMFEQMAEVLDE